MFYVLHSSQIVTLFTYSYSVVSMYFYSIWLKTDLGLLCPPVAMARSGFNQIVFIRMKICLDPDLMASSEANWCRSTLFTKEDKM